MFFLFRFFFCESGQILLKERWHKLTSDENKIERGILFDASKRENAPTVIQGNGYSLLLSFPNNLIRMTFHVQQKGLMTIHVLQIVPSWMTRFFFHDCHRLRVRFFGKIRKRICDPRSYGFFDTKETQNPKKDYFVITRQAGGTQYICQNDISLVLPKNSTRMEYK